MSPPFILTALVAQKKNTGRCSVFINDEFAFGCSVDIAVQFRLTKGLEVSAETLAGLQAHDELITLKQTALRYATYTDRTCKQVRDKMIEKGYTPQEADIAVEFLEEFGYLNDAVFARGFIRDFLKKKPSGKERLRQELRKRGISAFDIDDAFAELFPAESDGSLQYENALRAAEKKMRSLVRKEPHQQKQALIGYLQRQGFAWGTIRTVLEEVLDTTNNDNVEESDDEFSENAA